MKAWVDFKAGVAKVWVWLYREIGTVLQLLKAPVPGTSPVQYKFSSKRVWGSALIVNGLYGLRLKSNWIWVDLIVGGGQIIVGAVLLIVAATTKT